MIRLDSSSPDFAAAFKTRAAEIAPLVDAFRQVVEARDAA